MNKDRIDKAYSILAEALNHFNIFVEMMEDVISPIVVDGLYHGEWFFHHGVLIVKPGGDGKRLLGVVAMPELPIACITVMVHGELIGFAESVTSEEVHIRAGVDELYLRELVNDHRG